MIKVILADDHELVRAGIRLMLQDASDIEVVGEAGSGEEAIKLVQQLQPDLVLMDISMPGLGGFGASIRLLQGTFAVKVLIISSHKDHVIPARLLQLGASGYLSKEISAEELKKAIHSVYAGHHYVDSFLMDRVFESLSPQLLKATNSPFAELSERELQIMLMIARGMEIKEIAQKLYLSSKTINGYHRDILQKMKVKTDVELALKAIEYSLVDAHSQWH